MNKAEKFGKLNEIFTPGQPVNVKDLFYGRQEQLTKIARTTAEGGSHAVLYGDRGVGKTSLANVMKILIDGNAISSLPNVKMCHKVGCDPSDNFGDIWRKIFRKISINLSKPNLGFVKTSELQTVTLDSYVNQTEDLKPSDVIEILRSFPNCLLIFDEFENAKREVREKFSYTIKALSDEYPNTTLLLVGIAENIHGLIHDHRSLERCLKQIQLPHMSDDELGTIIDKGIEAVELTMDSSTRNTLVRFSQGFPYYVHLLGKSVAEIAIISDIQNINEDHLRIAIDDAIDNAHETTRMCYQSAISVNRNSPVTFEDIISACALASENQPDGFKICDLRVPLQQVTGRKSKEQNYRYHLDELCKSNRGNILKKTGTSNKYRYNFTSPLVKAFVYLKMYQARKI